MAVKPLEAAGIVDQASYALLSLEQACAFYPQGDPVHGFDHVLRVLRLVQHIGPLEGADMVLLETAALLHDIARAEEKESGGCHATLAAQRVPAILAGHPVGAVQAIAEAIRTHRFRANAVPQTLEARILYDADKLDAIGAVGIARAYAMAGQHDQPLWAEVGIEYAQRARQAGQADLVRQGHTPVHEYVFKLARVKDTLFTDTAKAIAAERHAYMAVFFDRLELEMRGEL